MQLKRHEKTQEPDKNKDQKKGRWHGPVLGEEKRTERDQKAESQKVKKTEPDKGWKEDKWKQREVKMGLRRRTVQRHRLRQDRRER